MLVVKTKSVNTSHYPPILPVLMFWTEYEGAVVVVTEIVDTEEGDAAICVIVDPGDSPYDPFTIFDCEDLIPMSELKEFFGQIVIESK